MARAPRLLLGEVCYHVLNRGNNRGRIFHKKSDYVAFLALIDQAQERLPIRLIGYCLMPNHFHLLLWPRQDGDLSRWMQWLTTTHVSHYHRHHGTSGHLWQGVYKSFPVQDDDHFFTVLRYIEANAKRAGLAALAGDWPWSSLAARASTVAARRLDRGPLALPADWAELVDVPLPEETLGGLRRSIGRGVPFGQPGWVEATARRLGLASTLRPPGRPKKG